MPVSGLLALLDDVSALMDDVATLTKVAAQKTAGIAGDDLAVNAEALVGLDPARELPVIGKVALGATVNKVILVPLALVLPAAAITPLLMLGGTFLCYEGFHKVAHKDDAADAAHHAALVAAMQQGPEALLEVESKKVRQAITTDFVLSAEIVAVALGAIRDEPLATRALVLSVVALGMTALIYGLVAILVKLDDIGLHMRQTGVEGSLRWRFGGGLLRAVPKIMKTISVLGTVAMFLVGGGIIAHGLPGFEAWLHHAIEGLVSASALVTLLSTVANLALGLVVGAVAALVVDNALRWVRAARAG